MVTQFPPVEWADDSGLLAMGGDLEVETLKLAYSSGIFPWPIAGEPLYWFAPPRRAILQFDELHIPERLQRYLKNSDFIFRVNSNFEAVIRGCAASSNRKGARGTWITREMIAAYIEFHRRGFAHSFETYNRKNELVGGMYGVKINKYFAGESMFYKESNASKFALIEAVRFLQNRGLTWMDVQTLTPLLKRLGAKEILRAEFMRKLREALKEGL
jgi:leucyl/phenylalanyl-tRNA--protein transferase